LYGTHCWHPEHGAPMVHGWVSLSKNLKSPNGHWLDTQRCLIPQPSDIAGISVLYSPFPISKGSLAGADRSRWRPRRDLFQHAAAPRSPDKLPSRQPMQEEGHGADGYIHWIAGRHQREGGTAMATGMQRNPAPRSGGLSFQLPPEGVCEINRSQEAKVLAMCTPGRFCRVYGIVESCKDSGECAEITRVLSVRRR